MFTSLFIRILALLVSTCCQLELTSAAGYMDQNAYTPQGKAQKVRRERNLDHWDSDTLAYHLDEYQGFDVAIMFYAMWDKNSQSLAPYWDQIATKLDAGTTRSRLVMALFDCELNVAHSELCGAVGITHYPTLMFIGSGPYHDTDPVTKVFLGKRAGGIMGEAPVPNTVKFQGNWQYIDSITDWIRTMQALSNWHTWTTQGFGNRLRTFFLPRKGRKSALPVGIPGGIAKNIGSTGHSGIGSDSSDSAMRVQTLENQVEQLADYIQTNQKTLNRWSLTFDSLLGGRDDRDIFAVMQEENGWTSSGNETHTILRNCVAEQALDYCQRASQKAADQLVNEFSASGMTVEQMLELPDLEQQIMDGVGKAEPYCGILEQCILSDFEGSECRPDHCPFQNQVACQYINACLDPYLQKEYEEALHGESKSYAGAA